jgi:hypothetical protein
MLVYKLSEGAPEEPDSEDLTGYELRIGRKPLRVVYSLYKDGSKIHESTLYRFTLLSLSAVLPGHRVIGNCRTVEAFRGKGIYGRMVRHIAARNGRCILFVDEANISSQKGLEKAGFTVFRRFRFRRFFGLFYIVRSYSL